jgi:hypothetical protein
VTTETKVEAVARYDYYGYIEQNDASGLFVRYSDHQSAITALEGEVAMLRDALHIETHKVITCGVAASHPDASLSRRMEYSGKWDSPQAQQVRALRDKADAAERRVAELEAFLPVLWEEYESAAEYMGEGCLGVDPYRRSQFDALTKESP